MAIVNLGNNPSDFGLDASTVSTSATGRDTNYSPSSILAPRSTSLSLEIPTTGTDYWFHWRMYMNNVGLGNSSGTGAGFSVYDTNGVLICQLAKTSTSNYNHFVRIFGSSTVTNGTALALANSGTYTIDVKLTVGGSGGSIVMELYLNGTLHSTSTATNSGTVKTQPRMATLDFAQNLNTGSTGVNFTEIIVATDESTVGARLATLEPSSAGAFSAMTGTVAALADSDTASGVFATAAAQRFNSVFSAYAGAASPSSIRGVFLKAKATAGGGSPSQLNQSIRIGGVNYDGVAATPVPGRSVVHEWANNPATSAPWVTAALAALEGGLLAA